jgi:hypothetical protein
MFCSTPNDGKIITAYADQFSQVWVVLSPFLRPQALPLERFKPETYPTRNEILADCEPVTWSEILRNTRFETLSEIDFALRTYYHGLMRPSRNLVEVLEQAINDLKLIPPDKGDLAPHNERSFFLRLKDLGHQHLLISDEFGEKTSREAIDSLLADEILPSHAVISTEDGSILISSHWDSCCSFLCAKEELDQFSDLEKFECTERTEVYWGLHRI